MTMQAPSSPLQALGPWLPAAAALAGALGAWRWAADSHAWNTSLAGAWCGLAPHGAGLEAGFLGHCAPCWAAAAAALLALGLVARAAKGRTRQA